jgi:hypothetical protein
VILSGWLLLDVNPKYLVLLLSCSTIFLLLQHQDLVAKEHVPSTCTDEANRIIISNTAFSIQNQN